MEQEDYNQKIVYRQKSGLCRNIITVASGGKACPCLCVGAEVEAVLGIRQVGFVSSRGSECYESLA